MVHFGMPTSVTKRLRQFGAAARGVAGVELALTAPFLAIGLVNAVDVGFYAYRRMEVENAAEVGAHAAWKDCTDPKNPMVPVTVKCTVANGAAMELNAAITAAIQSTTLGTAVSLASGYPKEDYYCVTSSNALQYQGSVLSTPADCSTGETPGDYIQVGVTYPYSPLFSGLISVMKASGITTITKTTWMRMG